MERLKREESTVRITAHFTLIFPFTQPHISVIGKSVHGHLALTGKILWIIVDWLVRVAKITALLIALCKCLLVIGCHCVRIERLGVENCWVERDVGVMVFAATASHLGRRLAGLMRRRSLVGNVGKPALAFGTAHLRRPRVQSTSHEHCLLEHQVRVAVILDGSWNTLTRGAQHGCDRSVMHLQVSQSDLELAPLLRDRCLPSPNMALEQWLPGVCCVTPCCSVLPVHTLHPELLDRESGLPNMVGM